MTMERKVGEIFEYNGEWYQCVEGACNNECYFYNRSLHKTIADINGNGFGACNACFRNDNKSVIFKKLEKVGEPYGFQKRTFQTYKLHTMLFLSEDVELVVIPSKDNNTIEIEIKQNKKEDMEIDKVVMNINDRDYLLNRLEAILHDAHCQYKNEICEVFSKYIVTETASGLKPFDLNAAKSGKPVCTRDGRKARVICFDAKFPQTGNIITLVEKGNGEEATLYHYDDGHCSIGRGYDLVMLSEKKEGWVNIYKSGECYNVGDFSFSKEEIEQHKNQNNYIATVKISWEE